MAAPPPMLPAPPAPAPTGGQLEPLPVVAPHYCVPYVVALNVKQDMSFAEGNFTITDANDAVVLRVKSPVFTIHNRRFLRDAADQPLLCMREKVFSLHNRWEVFRGDSYNDGDLLFTAKTTSVLQLFKTEMDIFLASNTAMEVCDFKMKGSFKERSCVFYLGNTNTMIAQVFSMPNRWDVFSGDSSNRCDLLFTARKSSVIQLRTHLDIFLATNTAQLTCDFKLKCSFNDRSWVLYRGTSSNVDIAQVRRQYIVPSAVLGRRTFDLTVFPNVDYAFITALVLISDEICRDRQH
ncbi:hypothetical protein EJB05_56797 [Eragrostis curvula]|uniref:Tubby C-terminal domain-containing protein n=1 Tax=Eragrostis curvula TaxID=38414 RepID=A0A5J9SGH3_9POAL|nr:hypothetical protein EJB05_56797 [Eragrostis curvula]